MTSYKKTIGNSETAAFWAVILVSAAGSNSFLITSGQTSGEQTMFNKFKHPDFGWTIEYPVGWKKHTDSDNVAKFKSPSPYKAIFKVDAYKYHSSLEDLASKVLDETTDEDYADKVKLIKKDQVNLGDEPAYMMFFSYYREDVKYLEVDYLGINRDRAHVIWFYAPENTYVKLLPLAQEMVNSFHFSTKELKTQKQEKSAGWLVDTCKHMLGMSAAECKDTITKRGVKLYVR